MPIEEMLNKIHEDEVAWDEIRERRVFNRIRKELNEPKRASSNYLPRIAYGSLAAALAILIVGFLVFRTSGDSVDSGAASAPAVAAVEEAEGSESSIMEIPGVGHVTLRSGARVAVWKQTSSVVKLRQAQGSAVYDIEHRSGRQVFVYANGVEIRVVGTVFTVTVQDELVNVDVDRGVVRVNDGTRLVELRAGEAIGVASRSDNQDRVSETAENAELSENTGASENGAASDLGQDPEVLAANEPTMEFHIDDTEMPDKWGPLEPTMDFELADTDNGLRKPSHQRQRMDRTGQNQRPLSRNRKSTKQLFNEVDRARKDGNFQEAAAILEEIIGRQDDRSSVVSALFVLGKVERARGKHGKAANVFARCHRLAPRGPLAEDALAEQAASSSRTQNREQTIDAAEAYLKRYPNGIHTERMNRILE